VAWLAERAEDGVRTLVGLDFPFAYAVPFLDHLDAPDFSALLARMAPLDEAPDRVDAFIARCGRWWARWGRHRINERAVTSSACRRRGAPSRPSGRSPTDVAIASSGRVRSGKRPSRASRPSPR
jgi:hypothetical protein